MIVHPLTIRRPRRRRVLLGVLLVSAFVLITFRRPLFFANFGVVSEGRVYRSAQPSGNFAEIVRDKQLKSVLNLRGGSMDDWWYANEIAVSEANRVDYYDFPMSATRRPSRQELLTLLTFFEKCRYPLLIHCRSGADRTGLASALYLMEVENFGPMEASRAFTIDYGHVPVWDTKKLHEPLDEYRQSLSAEGLSHSPARFREWVERDYRSRDRESVVRPLLPGPREKLAENPRNAPVEVQEDR